MEALHPWCPWRKEGALQWEPGRLPGRGDIQAGPWRRQAGFTEQREETRREGCPRWGKAGEHTVSPHSIGYN